MKICFFGVGGVGGYFGTLVARSLQNVHDIYFIARGAHKVAIIKNGLTLKKAGGNETINVSPKICTEKPEDLPICDIIILSVKGYDLVNAAKEISKISNNETVILPLLNGVDIYERIKEHLTHGIVLPSCVYVGTHIESPGIIYQKGGSCKISIGKDPKHPEFYPALLLNLLTDSKIDFDWEDNIEVSIWSKYIFIAAFGLITATYNKTLGEVLDNVELSNLTKSIVREIVEIARKLNIPLDPNIIETTLLKAKQFPYEAKTSFQRDVESKGRINEADLFGGTLIRYSNNLGIAIPNIKHVYNRFMNKFE